VSLTGFAEISRNFSAVRWLNKTEDCIFPRSFILRSNVQSFNISPSFNLAISSTFTVLFLFVYPFRKYTPLLCRSEISSGLILYNSSPLYLFSQRLMQLNVCHTLYSWQELLTHSPTYRIFPPDSSQFAGCSLLQSMTITIYFCRSPNHASIGFTTTGSYTEATVLKLWGVME